MKYTRKDIEDLRIEVNFVIEKEDYEQDLQQKLKEQQKTAQFKGFRKGKVPISLIKKMFGNSVLVDVINDVLGKEMDKYFEENKIKYIGEPMLADGHDPLDVDINNLGEYSFTFDLGLKPEFDIIGASENDSYEKYEIQVEDKVIQDELDVLRRRNGKQELVEENIEASDILTLDAVELDGKEKKENGWETNFTVMVETIGDEKLKEEILKQKKGYEFDFDVYNLEKDRDEAFVKKYFLNLDEGEEKEIGKDFRASIKEVRRLMPAEMNDEFFATNFAEAAKNEEEAKEFIRKQLIDFYDHEAYQVVYRNIMDNMLEKTQFELPASFLEKWLKSQEKNKELADEEIQKQLKTFLKEMRWSLIKSKLVEEHKIEVTEQDIRNNLYNKAQQYVNSQMQGFSDPTMMNQIFEYLAKDKNQVNQAADEVASNLVFDKLKDIVKLDAKKVSMDEFKDMVTSLNERIEAEKNA